MSTIGSTELRKVTARVLAWTGRQPPEAPTTRQRYLVEFAGQTTRPSYLVWAKENG